jgi:hypothetical protein
VALIPPYLPAPDTAAALVVWLGYVSLQGSVTDAGSPAVSTVSIPLDSWGVSFGGLTQNDVGDWVQVAGQIGSPSTYGTFWATITTVISATEFTISESCAPSSALQITVYRPLTEEFNNPVNYILQDSIVFDASITTRPTLDFTTRSGDQTLVPVVGMPVLMTDSQLDGSVSGYTLLGGGGYSAGNVIAVIQPGAAYACLIVIDSVSGGAPLTSHIEITPATGCPGGFGYVVQNGCATSAITGGGSGATVNILSVTGPAFSGFPGDVFGGSIEQAKIYNYPGTSQIKVECQCISWDGIFNHRVLGMTAAFPVSSTTLTFNGGVEQTGYSPVYGPQYWFNLGSPPPVAILSVSVNGTPATLGPLSALPLVGSGGYDFYWSFGDFQVNVDPSHPLFTDADSIVFVIQTVSPTAPSVTYQNLTADVIVTDIVGFIQDSENITLANVVSTVPGGGTVPLVNAITFLANQTVDQALASLMTYINDGATNFWYYLDPRKGFHFEILGVTTIAPWNFSVLDGSDANAQSEVSQLTTREKYANAAWINAESLGAAITQVIVGTGASLDFAVTYPIGALPTIVFCAGLRANNPPASIPAPYSFGGVTYPEPQSVGIIGEHGYQWYYQIGSNSIVEDSGSPAISDTEAIYVTYQPEIGLIQPYPNPASIPDAAMIARQMIEGGSGEYDITVDLTSQLPFVQGNTPAQAQTAASNSIASLLAAYFENMAQEVEVETYRPGLAPGQSILVDLGL